MSHTNTVVDLLRATHDQIEAYRVAHGFNPPQFGGGPWRCPPGYRARPFAPKWVSPDGDTVVEWGPSMEWAGPEFRSLVELIETCFWGHVVERFTWNTVRMGRTDVEVLHGTFVGVSAGFQLATTDLELVHRLAATASRSLPWQTAYESRHGYDPARCRNWKATSELAEEWARTLIDDYQVTGPVVRRADQVMLLGMCDTEQVEVTVTVDPLSESGTMFRVVARSLIEAALEAGERVAPFGYRLSPSVPLMKFGHSAGGVCGRCRRPDSRAAA